jgi:hypothetical protein
MKRYSALAAKIEVAERYSRYLRNYSIYNEEADNKVVEKKLS